MHKRNILHILAFQDSRKAGFALWLFILANVYYAGLALTGFSVDMWWRCMMASGGLLGGGTLLDKYLEGKAKTNASAPAA